MASIVPHGDGWRAHIYVKGTRDSEKFRTKREAVSWAERREEELRAGGGGADITFEQAAEGWLTLKLPSLDNEANQRTVEQSIRDYAIVPSVKGKRLREIVRTELTKVVKDIADAGKVETAHRVAQRIYEIFCWASDEGHIGEKDTLVAANLVRVLPSRTKRSMPAVSVEEIPTLLAKINIYPEPRTRIGLLLLAHTFTRTTELICARFPEIRDPETWVIPAERMKGKKERRKPQVVPLSRQVRALLDDARSFGGPDNDYFLPSDVNPMCGISNNTMLYALYSLGYKGKMTGHGFRAVASSALNESKLWSKDAIEKQLAHKETDEVRASYHRALYLDERRKMMQWWSDYLDTALASSTVS